MKEGRGVRIRNGRRWRLVDTASSSSGTKGFVEMIVGEKIRSRKRVVILLLI